MALWKGSWLERAGHASTRLAQQTVVVLGVVPWAWLIATRDVQRNLRDASFVVAVSIVILATCWSSYRIRCRVCQMPVYAMWLLGLPNREGRQAFERLLECPYCFDDGTGKLGDARAVDRRSELRRAWMLVMKVLLVIAFAFALFIFWPS